MPAEPFRPPPRPSSLPFESLISILLSVALIVSGLLALHLLVAAPARGGEVLQVDGRTHVRNAALPSQGAESLILDELWRAGGRDGDELFGIITRVLVDRSGNCYLLDSQLSQVHVYSPAGENLGALSREGEGPGEVRRPADMALLPGGVLALLQAYPAKIVKLSLDGTPIGSLSFEGVHPEQTSKLMLINVGAHDGNLVLGGMQTLTDDHRLGRARFVARYDESGRETHRYYEHAYWFDAQQPDYDEAIRYTPILRGWAVGPDGRVYIPQDRNRYAIHVYHPDGRLDRVIEREYVSWERTASERAYAEAFVEADTRHMSPNTTRAVAGTEPDIVSLQVAPDGTLWVKTSRGVRGQPQGTLATYDLFDPAGHFLKQVSIVCEGNGLEDELFFAGQGRAFLVKGMRPALAQLQVGIVVAPDDGREAQPMEVVAYRVGS